MLHALDNACAKAKPTTPPQQQQTNKQNEQHRQVTSVGNKFWSANTTATSAMSASWFSKLNWRDHRTKYLRVLVMEVGTNSTKYEIL